MKKVTLTPRLEEKLSRLAHPAGTLTYDGVALPVFDNKKIVAIVGTRKPTAYGKTITTKLAETAANHGIVTISGLAIGIDGLAHEATLAAHGQTIAVLPSGIEKIYPALHRQLAKKIIASNGTLVSEYEPSHTPRKREFIERNRLIAALADLVIIPEAALRSGSLNTAQNAFNMSIPVAVVPGNITSPMSEGTNFLLKKGAHALTAPTDMLDLLGLQKSSAQTALSLDGDDLIESLILKEVAHGRSSTTELQHAINLPIIELQTALTMLEVKGRVKADELGNWQLI